MCISVFLPIVCTQTKHELRCVLFPCQDFLFASQSVLYLHGPTHKPSHSVSLWGFFSGPGSLCSTWTRTQIKFCSNVQIFALQYGPVHKARCVLFQCWDFVSQFLLYVDPYTKMSDSSFRIFFFLSCSRQQTKMLCSNCRHFFFLVCLFSLQYVLIHKVHGPILCLAVCTLHGPIH